MSIRAGALLLPLLLLLSACAGAPAEPGASAESSAPAQAAESDVSAEPPGAIERPAPKAPPQAETTTRVIGALKAGEEMRARGDLEAAARLSRRALEIAEADGDPILSAAAGGALGMDLLSLGDAPGAAVRLRGALVLWEEIEGPLGDYAVRARLALARAEEESGRPAEAGALLRALHDALAARLGADDPRLDVLEARASALEAAGAGSE